MKVIYKGVDIYPDLSINACIHNMYSDKQADTVNLTLNDTQYLWDKWNPQKGDEIEVSTGSVTTGTMFITDIKPTNGLFNLTANSLPTTAMTPKNRAWESIHLHQIAKDIAKEHNLKIEFYGVQNYFYKYIQQSNENDFILLQYICILESLGFLIFDKKIIIYSESTMESEATQGSIDINPSNEFVYEDKSNNSYSHIAVSSGNFKGEYVVPNKSKTKLLTPKRRINVTSNDEAGRFAKGLIRDANKKEKSGVFYDNLLKNYAPGSVSDLKTFGHQSWTDKVFIYQLRNDYMKNTSKVFFRKPLEGY